MQLLPDRGLFPFPGKLPHLLQKQVSQAGIAAVHHQIAAVPVLGAAFRHGHRAGPCLIVAGDAPIPFLLPDRIGQHILHSVQPELFQNIVYSGFGIQPVIAVMAADCLLDGLLAGMACLKRGVVLCHLPMLGRIRRRMGIEGRVFQFFLSLIQLVCSGFDGVPDHIHVAGFQLLKVLVNIGQRRGRIKKRLCLGLGQLQFLHAHHDVLPDRVLIGMV